LFHIVKVHSNEPGVYFIFLSLKFLEKAVEVVQEELIVLSGGVLLQNLLYFKLILFIPNDLLEILVDIMVLALVFLPYTLVLVQTSEGVFLKLTQLH
jgi:hypothetical protein